MIMQYKKGATKLIFCPTSTISSLKSRNGWWPDDDDEVFDIQPKVIILRIG